MSTLDFLTRWRLIARLNWLSVVNAGRIMLNRDRRVWGSFTLKVNRFWNLAIDDLPTSWNFRVGLNILVRLTTYRVALNRLVILINVVDVGSLIISRVANVDGLILLTILNRYRWNIRLGSRVTGKLTRLEVCPGVF